MIAKFKHCKPQEDGSVTTTAPGATLKARVRLAHKLCLEQATPTNTVSSPQPQVIPQTQLDAVAKITEHVATMTKSMEHRTTGKQFTAQTSTVGARNLKLKELVDQVSEEECDLLTDQQLLACYARWETLMGTNETPSKFQDPHPSNYLQFTT